MYISDKFLSYTILFLGLVITVLLLELVKPKKAELFTVVEDLQYDEDCQNFYEIEEDEYEVEKIKHEVEKIKNDRIEIFVIVWNRLLPIIQRVIIKSVGLSIALDSKIDVYNKLESIFESIDLTSDMFMKSLYDFYKKLFFSKNQQLFKAIDDEWVNLCKSYCSKDVAKQLCEENLFNTKFCESINQIFQWSGLTNDLTGSDLLQTILDKTGITQSSPINQDFTNLGISNF